MKFLIRAAIILVSLFVVFSYFNDLDFRRRDENTVRKMFRLPTDVEMLTLESEPKTGGTFGREGLRIGAVFVFSDEQLQRYVELLPVKDNWVPVSDRYTIPNIDSVYSEASLEWNKSPLPGYIIQSRRSNRFYNLTEFQNVKEGFYYCAIAEYRHDKIPHYSARHACSERQNLEGWKFYLGILDLEAKKLFVEIL